MRYPKHGKAVQQAKNDLANGVRERPMGSNTNGRVRVMQKNTWLGGTGWPWCVAACITWALEAGFKLPYKGAGAYAYLDWARQHGWTCQLGQAVPGDFVVWNIGAGHMSMLVEKYRAGEPVHTIDGNSSDRVKENWRQSSLVRGIVHLPEDPAKLPPAKPPLFEVVTSESGHKVIYTSTASRIGKKLPQLLAKHAKLTVRRKKKR